MAVVEFVALVLFAGGMLLLRFALVGYAGPWVGSTPESTATIASLRRRAPSLAILGLLLVAIAVVFGAASGRDPLSLVAIGGLLGLVLIGPMPLVARWWARRVSTKRAVYGCALLFAGPVVAMGMAQAISGKSDPGELALWLVIAAIYFVVSAAVADLILRAFEGDRPRRDEPPGVGAPPGPGAGPTV